MSEIIQAVRGMNDVLPAESAAWQALERAARETFADYGYREIRVPLLERTELFKRSIGELTDIVEKEMYTFDDRGGESLTLRPEATAGIVRASITNGLLYNQRQKVWCMGPMFRYERPQKGRYRQFHQIDVEALGFPGPDVDAELIMMSARLWRRLGLRVYGREMFETWYKMSAMLQSGLDISPIITHRLPIAEFRDGFEIMRSGQSGKVILDWAA